MNAMADEVLNGTYKCGVPRSDAFVMLRDAKSSDLPWPGFVFGQTPATIWYWCADQVSLQTLLPYEEESTSAKTQSMRFLWIGILTNQSRFDLYLIYRIQASFIRKHFIAIY